MSKAHAWVIPDELPASYSCRVLYLPDDYRWLAIFSGVLDMLTEPGNFEQLGDVTPEQAANVFQETWYRWTDNDGECFMFAGMVCASARETAPNERWLACDGTAYGTTEYPALYAAIGTVFGDNGAGTFRVPDLAGRLPVGIGSGSGLTPRALADSGGEEAHALSVAELAEHSHSLDLTLLTGSVLGVPLSGQPGGDYGDLSTKDAGSGTAHNTMPPFLGLQFFIYTG